MTDSTYLWQNDQHYILSLVEGIQMHFSIKYPTEDDMPLNKINHHQSFNFTISFSIAKAE